MWQYNDSQELRHYGVLGMKWGIRRAQQKGTSYTYKSKPTKKYERLAKLTGATSNVEKKISDKASKAGLKRTASAFSKASEYDKRATDQNNALAKKYASYDQKRQQHAEKISVKRAVAEDLVTGAIRVGKIYAADKLLYGGALTSAVKSTTKAAGRSAVEAYLTSKGATNLTWID